MNNSKTNTDHIIYLFFILRPQSTVASLSSKNKIGLARNWAGGEPPPNNLRLAHFCCEEWFTDILVIIGGVLGLF